MRGVHRPGYMAEYRARKVIERDGGGLLPFQQRFVAALTRKHGAPEIGICCTPRAQESRGCAGS